MEFCGKTEVPIGAIVRIVKNFGNECEPFLNLLGIATHPFRKGCKKEGWIGVRLETETDYGSCFNFHIDEIEVL
jgi:hypothetical protein